MNPAVFREYDIRGVAERDLDDATVRALRGTDDDGNTVAGQAVIVDGSGNIAIGDDDTLIAMVGVSDLVVVKAGDAILVVPRAAAQDVRKIVEALSARGLARYL